MNYKNIANQGWVSLFLDLLHNLIKLGVDKTCQRLTQVSNCFLNNIYLCSFLFNFSSNKHVLVLVTEALLSVYRNQIAVLRNNSSSLLVAGLNCNIVDLSE